MPKDRMPQDRIARTMPEDLGQPLPDPRDERFARKLVRPNAHLAREYAATHPGEPGTGAELARRYDIVERVAYLKRALALEQLQGDNHGDELNKRIALGVLRRRMVYDPRGLFDADGNALKPQDIPDDLQWAIDGIEVTTKSLPEGATQTQFKYKLADRTATLTLAMRHLGMLIDKHEITGRDGGPVTVRRADEMTDDELALIAAATDFAKAKPVFSLPPPHEGIV